MSLIRIGDKPAASFADPVAFLAGCHQRIAARLTALENALQGRMKPVTLLADGEPALATVAEAVDWLATTGAQHTDDEDVSLFPRLRGGDIDATLEALGAQHRAAEAMLLAIRTALETARRPDAARAARAEIATHIAAFVTLEREHMALEERVLFPQARALDDAQLRAIAIEMSLRRGGVADPD